MENKTIEQKEALGALINTLNKTLKSGKPFAVQCNIMIEIEGFREIQHQDFLLVGRNPEIAGTLGKTCKNVTDCLLENLLGKRKPVSDD